MEKNKKMNFDEAWKHMDWENKCDRPIVEIRFKNSKDGSMRATMSIPNLYRNPEKSMKDLKLAWETCCRSHGETMLNSIISISVYEESIREKELGRRESA